MKKVNYLQRYIELSTKIYDTGSLKQYWRMLVFVVRSMRNNGQMKELLDFFEKDSLRSDIAIAHPCIFEQLTRYWFYYNSTFIERLSLIKDNFCFLDKRLTQEAIYSIYLGPGITLWENDYHGQTLSLTLHYDEGHKKEGLMAISFKVDARLIYRIIFWISSDKDGQLALWIGALQGTQDGSKLIRDLTKYFFGYRPKNFILHALRVTASQLGIEKIYAVSNSGFYANNHVRFDRKLKTCLDSFWKETGGRFCSDERFFELPVIEPRKSLDEVQSHKRNLYRKRFAALDEKIESIRKATKPYLK